MTLQKILQDLFIKDIETLQDSVSVKPLQVNHLTAQEWENTRVLPKVQSNGIHSINPGCTQAHYDAMLPRIADSGCTASNSSIRPYRHWKNFGIMFALLLVVFNGFSQAIPKAPTTPARTITSVVYAGGGEIVEILDNKDSIVYKPGKNAKCSNEFSARMTSDVFTETFGNNREFWIISWRGKTVETITYGMWTSDGDWRRIYVYEAGKGFQSSPNAIR